MGINSRNEIISNIYQNKNFVKYVNIRRPDGKNALHFMSGNSILGTKLLLLSGADKLSFDKFGNTPASYAFYFGRFDCYKLLINKNGSKFDLSLKENIRQLVLNEDKKEDNFKITNFKSVKYFFEKNDSKNAKLLLYEMKKENIKLNDKEIYDLIDLSCKNRNIELLKLLDEFK